MEEQAQCPYSWHLTLVLWNCPLKFACVQKALGLKQNPNLSDCLQRRAATVRAVRAGSRYGAVGRGLTERHLTGHKSHAGFSVAHLHDGTHLHVAHSGEKKHTYVMVHTEHYTYWFQLFMKDCKITHFWHPQIARGFSSTLMCTHYTAQNSCLIKD